MLFFLPRRLFFYILRETIPFIALTLIVLTVLVFAQQIAKQTELLFQSNAAFALTLKVLLYLLPGVIVITLPFALLIGSLLALNRLSSDTEIIAARASGISLMHLSQPLILCGLIGTLICGYFTLYLTPRIVTESKLLKNQLILLALAAPLKPQIFDNHFPNHVIFLRDIDKSSGDWLGVFIVRKTGNGETNVLTAQRGHLRLTQSSPVSLEVDLIDGLLLNYNENLPAKQTAIKFTQQAIRLADNTPAVATLLEKDKSPQELPLKQLLAKESRVDTPQEKRQVLVERHKRFAIPIACLVLILLAIPLGTSTARQGGKAMAFSTGFTLAVLYYLVSVAGQNLSLSGSLSAWLGIWLANFLGLFGAFFLLLGKDKPIFVAKPKPRTSTAVKTITGGSPRAKQLTATTKTRLNISNRLSILSKSSFVNLINYLLLSEYAKFFSLSVLILVGTSIIFTLFDLVPSINKSGLGWAYALGYLLYLAPQIIYYTAPFAVLIGLLSVFSILMKSNQITALLASGQSKLRLAMPLLMFSLLIITALFWLSENILPQANQEQDFRFNRLKGRKTEQTISALNKLWVQGIDGTLFGYQLNQQEKQLLNTDIYSFSSNNYLTAVHHIQSAEKIADDQWISRTGWQTQLQTEAHDLVLVQFNDLSQRPDGIKITVPESARLFSRVVNEASKMNFSALKNYIHQLGGMGASTTSLRVDLEKKLAFPFSCLPLLAIGFPLALKNSRRGTMTGIGLSIVIGFTYWIAASVFESLGRQAYLPPGLSVWGPQALFFAIGVVLMFRLKK